MMLSVLLFSSVICAQTNIPAGPISGNWNHAGSPYLIQGEVSIPLDNTLVIDAGVEVYFEGHFKFIIYGSLQAVGTVEDSILFSTEDPETGWHGLRFIDTESNSQTPSNVSHCIVEFGRSYGTCPDNSGAGIYIGHANPVISNSTIRNNSAVSGNADWGGGGIYTEYASPIIRENLIANNYSGHDGGGIYCGYGSPLISNNEIVGNEAAYRGAGIACFNFSSPDILNNQIENNSAASIGGGIYQSGGNSLIESNTIRDNYAGDGGGVACFLSNSRLYNNLITDNESYTGAALWNQGSSPQVFNNTIIKNMATDYGGGMMSIPGMAGIVIYSNPLIANNIIYENIAEEGTAIYSNPDNIPVLLYNNIEGLTGTGIYGEVNEMEGNFDFDPLFDPEGEHECALSQYSMCIDHGVNMVMDVFPLPETDILGNQRIWDGDNDEVAFVDMGAYEYGSSPLGTEDGIQTGLKKLAISPNPFFTSVQIAFELTQAEVVAIIIYNQVGEQLDINERKQAAGNQQFVWNTEGLPAGIYFCVLKTESRTQTVKMIKLK